VSLRTTDFDELARSVNVWDATFRQMAGGRFSGAVTGVRVGAVGVSRITLSHTVQLRGVLRRPAYLFTPVVGRTSRAVWRGNGLRPGQVNLVGPETHIDHLSAPAADYLMVAVDRDRLHEVGGGLSGIDLGDYLRGRLAVGPPPRAFLQLLARIRGLLARPLAPGEQAGAEAELLRLIARSVVSGDPTLEENAPPASRLRIARRAEEFMLANLARPVTVLEICRVLDVSERTLQYAFQERFGMTPKAYLKAHRLNAVRRELKVADPTAAAVHEIAGRWGFTHPGEFAADYRRLFGELPSATLARG
jgi:AraC family ethanolamine operon transcriptional activator